MILFNNTTTYAGKATLMDTLGYVQDVIISNDRITMSTTVNLSWLSSAILNPPDYTAYTIPWPFEGIPFDSESDQSPAAQCYTWLINQPQFSGGTSYPPAE